MTGKTGTEYLENQILVLKRLKESEICLKKDKCSCKLPSIEYLRHKVFCQTLDALGLSSWRFVPRKKILEGEAVLMEIRPLSTN